MCTAFAQYERTIIIGLFKRHIWISGQLTEVLKSLTRQTAG